MITLLAMSLALPSLTAQKLPYWRGVDASFVPEYRALRATFKRQGKPVEALKAFADTGSNMLRLRVWVNPKDGYCGLEQTLKLAAEAKQHKMDLLLDFHYSDTWADPQHQITPEAWQSQNLDQLAKTVEKYSASVVSALVKQGTPPTVIAVGNEVRMGMMWPLGKIVEHKPEGFIRLLKAGVKGSRSAMPKNSKYWIQVHHDSGGDNKECRWFFGELKKAKVDYDMIGLSYYPWWHGTLAEMTTNVNDLAVRFGKPIMLAETAYPFTLKWKDSTGNFLGEEKQLLAGYPATPIGQAAFLNELHRINRAIPNHLGVGICYWAPEYIAHPGIKTPYENLALFDFDNELLLGAKALGETFLSEIK